jgi:hypothetical protein
LDFLFSIEEEVEDATVTIAKYVMYEPVYMIGYNFECIDQPWSRPVRIVHPINRGENDGDAVDDPELFLSLLSLLLLLLMICCDDQYVAKTGNSTISDSDEPLVQMFIANGLYNHQNASTKLVTESDC